MHFLKTTQLATSPNKMKLINSGYFIWYAKLRTEIQIQMEVAGSK